MQSKKIYLITGGSGFIGSALSEKLKGAIISESRSKPHKIKRHITYLQKSVSQLTLQDVEGVDVIYHCASTVDNYHILDNPHLDIDTNVKEFISLLETVKNLKKKPKLIFLSTFFVYGNTYQRLKKPIDEESPTDPLSLYPATKLCAESILKLYGKLYHISYVICRLTNIYGPGDKATHKKGVLNYFIKQALEGKKLQLYDNGNFIRDYLFIDDLINALQILETKALNDTYLVGYGTSVAFKDMIAEIHRLTKSSSQIVSIKSPAFHQAVGVFDFKGNTAKIRALGWKPKIDHKTGLHMLVNAVRNQS